MANAVRRGELLERDDVKTAWGGIVLAIREGFLNLSAVALQRGIVTPEREPDLQTLVDEILRQLSEGGRPALAPHLPFLGGATERRRRRQSPANEPV